MAVRFDDQAFGELVQPISTSRTIPPSVWLIRDRRPVPTASASHYRGCAKRGMNVLTFFHESPNAEHKLVEWLRQNAHPLGVYAYTDQQAVWLRDIMLQAGIAVPGQVAILGTGDFPRSCLSQEPTLSSIAYPWKLIGQSAARHVHHHVASGTVLEPAVLRPYVIRQRTSTQLSVTDDPLVRRAQATKHLSNTTPLESSALASKCSITPMSAFSASPWHHTNNIMTVCVVAKRLLANPQLKIGEITNAAAMCHLRLLVLPLASLRLHTRLAETFLGHQRC